MPRIPNTITDINWIKSVSGKIQFSTELAKIETNVNDTFKNSDVNKIDNITNSYQFHAKNRDLRFKFRQCYFLWKCKKTGIIPIIQELDICNYINYILSIEQSRYSFEVIRLRFLSVSRFNLAKELLSISEPLLSLRPNDFDVRYSVTRILANSNDEYDWKKCLSMLLILAKENPNDYRVMSTTASIYWNYWSLTKQKNQADKAIFYYQESIKHCPQKSPWRQDALINIKIIQSKK